MKKIISFSLWGRDPKYWKGAIENIRLAREIYPGWVCRFYVDAGADARLVDLIRGEDCEIVPEVPLQSFSGLFWRFYAADDADVMLSRDADSRISEREALAVRQWLDSGRQFHIMRDHPFHKVRVPGGMWGCRGLEGLSDLVRQYPYQDLKGTDQLFLAQMVYPQVKEFAMVHDSYNLFGDGMPFPSERKGSEFVGEVFDQYGKPMI